jgi:arylsulfatase A
MTIHQLFGGVCLLVMCASASMVMARDNRPNIIFFYADDLGYGDIGCYGQQIIKTPNIDRIAREGIRFTQHYSGQAVCAPARCSLMTGKHQGHAFIRNNGNPKERVRKNNSDPYYFPGQNPIPDGEITIGELLKERGYSTAAIGKWGLGYQGSSGDPNRQGFDLFYGFNCQRHAHNHYPRFLVRNDTIEKLAGNDRTATGQSYSQDLFIEEAKKFIRENQSTPFFLYMPFAVPHLAIQVPDAELAQYDDVIKEKQYNHRGYIEHARPRAGYAAMISHLDRGIGEIMALLKELQLDENTIVIFTSDNGPVPNRLGGTDSKYFKSAGPFRGRKGSLYEGGIRVPLIVRWPGKIAASSESDHVCANWDFLPTFCEITGIKPPQKIDGISFAPTLLGNHAQQQSHDYLYWEFPAYGGQQAIRKGKWKGVRQSLTKNPSAPIELYDLEKDISEKSNVADENPAVVRELKQLMAEAHTPSELFPFPALDRNN